MSFDQIENYVETAFGGNGYAAKELVAADSILRADLKRGKAGHNPGSTGSFPVRARSKFCEQYTRRSEWNTSSRDTCLPMWFSRMA